jgi:formate dehydrogenase iron-sulfur subunit
MALALLIDITRCIGCRGCVSACKEAHGLPPGDADTTLSATALTALADLNDEVHVRKLCMHCLEPSCASVCPVGALHRTPQGAVEYSAGQCLGCRYCMLACPFGVPRYEWTSVAPAVRKCDLCAARRAQGQVPACVEICPAEATQFGERDELLAEAHRRLSASPGDYAPHVYGESEVGGTSVLFLSPVPFEQLGFRVLGTQPLPELTWVALEKVPGVVALGGTLLSAVWWITHRREEVAAVVAAAPGTKEVAS